MAIFAEKAEAPPNGFVRDRRTTMLSDAEYAQRHARAALGAVIASVTGDCNFRVQEGNRTSMPARRSAHRRDHHRLIFIVGAQDCWFVPSPSCLPTAKRRRIEERRDFREKKTLRSCLRHFSRSRIDSSPHPRLFHGARRGQSRHTPAGQRQRSGRCARLRALREPRAARLRDRLSEETSLPTQQNPRLCAITQSHSYNIVMVVPVASFRRSSGSRRISQRSRFIAVSGGRQRANVMSINWNNASIWLQ